MLKLVTGSQSAVVEMPDKIVFANAEKLKVELHRLIDEGNTNLAINLKYVDFIDSSGLAVLVSALKKAQTYGGTIYLLSPTNNVKMLIELTRLHLVFEILEDVDALTTANIQL